MICYYCGSRKTMLSLALLPLVVPVMALRRNPAGRIRWATLLFVTGVTVLFSGLILANLPHLERLALTLQDGAQAESSSSVRLAMVERAVTLWADHPLFGRGFQGFARLGGFGGYSHSTFPEVLCNGGLLGMLLLGVFYIVPAWQLAGLTRARSQNSQGTLSRNRLLGVHPFGCPRQLKANPDTLKGEHPTSRDQSSQGSADTSRRLALGLLVFWGQFTLFSCFAVMLDPGEYLPIYAGVCGYLQEQRSQLS